MLDPWQADVLEESLGERDDGKWAALRVALVVPRQNGKGSILEARELAGLFLFGDRLMIHSAHEFKTAQEHYARLWGLIEQTPDLERLVTKKLENNNGMLIQVGRQRLRFLARSRSSGRGFSGDLVVLDEAFQISSRAVSAMLPTLSARPNPQVWFTSSAPEPEEHSDTLRRICREGRSGDGKRLAYFEWCAPADSEKLDKSAWALANPGYPYRVDDDWIETVELPTMDDDEFLRERLGIWPDNDGTGRIIPLEAWQACLDPDSSPQGPEFFALDVSPSRQWSSVGVAASSRTGTTHVECIEHKPGTDWLVPACVTLRDAWGATIGVASGSPAASLIPDLERAGVPVVEISTGAHAQACGGFFDAVTQARVTHRGQPSLNVAVDSADRKFYGDSWLWARRTSGEITPLVAVTLAKWLHDQAPPPASGFVDLSDYDD